MLREFDTTIAGKKAKTIQHAARFGINLTVRLLRVFGPVLDAVKGEEVAFGIFTSKLNDDEVLKLILDLLAYTWYDGKQIGATEFDEMFAGEYAALYQLVLWVVEKNGFFGKFDFGKLLTQGEKLLKSNVTHGIDSTKG
jgi:hypothetical protein